MAKSSSDEDIHWTIGIAHQELFYLYIYICTEFLEYIYAYSIYTPRAGSGGRQETKCDGMTGIQNQRTGT